MAGPHAAATHLQLGPANQAIHPFFWSGLGWGALTLCQQAHARLGRRGRAQHRLQQVEHGADGHGRQRGQRAGQRQRKALPRGAAPGRQPLRQPLERVRLRPRAAVARPWWQLWERVMRLPVNASKLPHCEQPAPPSLRVSALRALDGQPRYSSSVNNLFARQAQLRAAAQATARPCIRVAKQRRAVPRVARSRSAPALPPRGPCRRTGSWQRRPRGRATRARLPAAPRPGAPPGPAQRARGPPATRRSWRGTALRRMLAPALLSRDTAL